MVQHPRRPARPHGAARLFAQAEGIVPAPESSHAIAAVIRKALALKEEGKSAGAIEESLKHLPEVKA